MRAPLVSMLGVLLASCGDVNLFTVQDDIDLGSQLKAEIDADPVQFPVLNRATYADAYDHMERIRDTILQSGEVEHADQFEWTITIIDDDEVLNAFAAPGGYIWVYTGLIRFLDREDDLAGVMGHEIAHAALRHSTEQLTKAYGVDVLLGVVFGEDPGLIPELAAGLAGLSFSKQDESEADDSSVSYLCNTGYASDGAAGFFEKLVEEGGPRPPAFLSTHPDPENRVEAIQAAAEERNCSTEASSEAQWADLLASLP